MSDDTLLSVENLHAGYGTSEVITGVSFDVVENETVALLGRNGVGKTTTLRCIIGSLTPTEGSITYKCETLAGLDITERVQRGMTLVPEDRRVFPDLTVTENLLLSEYGAEPSRSTLSTKEEVFDLFENLDERRAARAGTLSGGEQQMLALGQALVTGADLILLDEPTEGLAPTIVDELLTGIETLQAAGCTVVLVEQNLDIALQLADRTFIINHGEVVFAGSSTEIANNEEVIGEHLGVKG